MTYKIFKDGELINRIEADENFTTRYCEKMGYTYEAEEPAPVPDPAPTEAEQMRADLDYLSVMTGVSLV